jgi:hypothetical protein
MNLPTDSAEEAKAYLDHRWDRPDVRTFGDLLRSYEHRPERFALEFTRRDSAGLLMPEKLVGLAHENSDPTSGGAGQTPCGRN